MTVVNNGKDTIRDAILTTVDKIAAGTDGSGTTSNMTSLIDEVIRKTSSNLEGQDLGESLHRIRLTVSEANGETLREVGTLDSSGDLISRNAHAPIDKNNTFELVYEISINAKNKES